MTYREEYLEIRREMNKDFANDVYQERGYYIMEEAFDKMDKLCQDLLKELEGEGADR